jgi:hypothetical protein
LFAADDVAPPVLSLVWTGVVDIAAKQDLGLSPDGHRYIVPILGGTFAGGPGFDGLSGTVLPGGADRQLVDRHGFKTLDALYEMKTDDGAVLTIRNRVKIDEAAGYRQSVIGVVAPSGRFDWMNRRIFLGTMATARPEREAVIIRGWVGG